MGAHSSKQHCGVSIQLDTLQCSVQTGDMLSRGTIYEGECQASHLATFIYHYHQRHIGLSCVTAAICHCEMLHVTAKQLHVNVWNMGLHAVMYIEGGTGGLCMRYADHNIVIVGFILTCFQSEDNNVCKTIMAIHVDMVPI